MIRKAIIFHELMPKEQLIEEKLSESLSISRTPLRTALRRLIDEGLVETKGKNLSVIWRRRIRLTFVKCVFRLNLQ